MKTKIQSLFMALLLVFAVLPASILAQEDIEANIINILNKYPYDVDDMEDYIANHPEDEEVSKLVKEYGRISEEALAEGDKEKLARVLEGTLSSFDQIITSKYGVDSSRQLMTKYTQYRKQPDMRSKEPISKEPVTFLLYPGDQRKLESNLVLTYLGSSQNPSQKPTQMACTEELKLCSDGTTYVGRDSNRNCAWNACPGELEMFNSISDSLAEGAEKTYVLQGDMAYAVEVMIIEDTTPATVTFNINGEVTNQLSPGKSVSLKNGVSILVHNIALRTASGDDFVKFTLGFAGSARATNSVDADKGVCEQFSMTFATPAVLNKLLPPDANYGFSPYTPRYKEEYKKLEAAFRADYERAVAAGDEEAVMKVKKAFEEQTQALSKKYSVETSDDVAYAYPEKEDSDASYTYPYNFEDFPEDKEVAKLKEEFERKYAKAVAEGDEEKAAKLKEEYLRKFDKIVVKKYDSDASRQPITSKPGKPGMMIAPMHSETKTFCILPGEVGYPIMLYEQKADGAVLVGYNTWKGENPSYYVAANGQAQARQTSYGSPQEKDSCQVEGNGAIPVGTRLNVEGKSQYCDALTKKMMIQKQDGEQAENDYECLSNEQNNGQCVNSLNILQKIWKGITGIFGF